MANRPDEGRMPAEQGSDRERSMDDLERGMGEDDVRGIGHEDTEEGDEEFEDAEDTDEEEEEEDEEGSF